MSGGRRLTSRFEVAGSLVLSMTAWLVGCGPPAPAAPATPPTTPVVAAPASWPAGGDVPDVDVVGALEAGLRRAGGTRVVPAREVFAGAPPGCADDTACLVSTGRRTGARKLVQARIASLGTTTVVRVVVLDLTRGAQEQTRQEIVRDADDRAIAGAVGRAAELLARPWAPPPRERPRPTAWYESGWLWASVAAAAASGAAVAIGVAATAGSDEPPSREPEERPDYTLTPP